MRCGTALFALLLVATLSSRATAAGPSLLFDVESGKVLYAEDQDNQWHPASLAKLMTAYLAFEAVKSGKLALNQKIACSAAAHAEPPSKVGLPIGGELTVDKALQALIIKSANDVAVMLAEAIGGSEADFVAKMNATAQRLGMSRTKFINPNGLPADDQVTTARDLAKLSRAIVTEFPEFAHYWSMAQMRIGKNRVRSHNGLLDTVEGADGLKTGFTCDSGYNIVASATRDGHRLVAVVLGDSSAAERNTRASSLLEYGFQQTGLTQVFNTQTVDNMPLNSTAEGVKSVRASVESWACNPKPHILNAQKAHRRTAKKGGKKDKDAAKGETSAEAGAEADVTTGALKTEAKPVLRAQEE
ncbi:MAG TPA: D-alanyl-D-alanine carboxypeptidase family protein [Hyphomicrobium sp.]|nr:D-alanyl-D-alanine carboxypeptidase family protein [Hyphomicrobium sp.]